jgi:L,D-peptidoglycan transpeptidase YkuD (ErfK/YbiS/YcfS/YnhG family)
MGKFALRAVYYRRDRTGRPASGLPIRCIGANDGWCDAPADRNYNRAVRHPYPASAEHLWREDRLYDLVIVIGYNDVPRLRGAGSAIFIHAARPDFTPTEGCIALAPASLRRLAAMLRRSTRIVIAR